MASETRSQRPYLIRAMHEWMTDSGQTPHVVVNALIDGVHVPQQHIQDGKIILNVSHAAVQNLNLGNDKIRFEARFAGTPYQVRIPISAVLGVYARESSQGMVFSDEATAAPDNQAGAEKPAGPSGESGRAHLRVIK